jgi:hypothetical protein
MLLAEALILRADVQTRTEQVKQRILRVVKVQEGETPAEDPQVLMLQLDQLFEELTSLVQRINRTNVVTPFNERMNLADALALRDTITKRQKFAQELAQNGSSQSIRLMRTEIRFVSTVNVAEVQRQADAWSGERRELETRIQELNWTTQLVE